MTVWLEGFTQTPDRPFPGSGASYILNEVRETRRMPGVYQFNASSDHTCAVEGQGGAAKGELP
jgi:hypothetical protein